MTVVIIIITPFISVDMLLRRCRNMCFLITVFDCLLVSRLIKETTLLWSITDKPLRDSLLVSLIFPIMVATLTVLAFLRLLKVLLLIP